jgi:hypothetical protein
MNADPALHAAALAFVSRKKSLRTPVPSSRLNLLEEQHERCKRSAQAPVGSAFASLKALKPSDARPAMTDSRNLSLVNEKESCDGLHR